MESRWMSARARMFDPQVQLAGSEGSCSTRLTAPQRLQVNTNISSSKTFYTESTTPRLPIFMPPRMATT